MEETQLKFAEVLASFIVAVLILAFCAGAVSLSHDSRPNGVRVLGGRNEREGY